MTRHRRLRTREELGLPRWGAVVEGSVDDPPIVMRKDRLKLTLTSLACLAFLGLVLLIPVRTYSGWHLIIYGSLVLCTVMAGIGAMFPTTLILDPSGLVVRTAFRTVEHPWSRFDGFRWHRRQNLVAVVLGDLSDRPKVGWRRFLAEPLDLGSAWELPASRVVDVLNESLALWGPRR
jgi:hypothetical protein